MKNILMIKDLIKYSGLTIISSISFLFLFNFLHKNGNDFLLFSLIVLYTILLAIGMVVAKHFYKTRDTYVVKSDEKLMVSLNVALLLISGFLLLTDSLNETMFKFIIPTLFYFLSSFILYSVNKISLQIKHHKKLPLKTIRLT